MQVTQIIPNGRWCVGPSGSMPAFPGTRMRTACDVRGQVLGAAQGVDQRRGCGQRRPSHSMTLTSRPNGQTDRPLVCRAVPPVGSTWFEPAR